MSYRFKVERGWASSGYGAKTHWDKPETFTVMADSEKEAIDKVKELSDTKRLYAGNHYLYRVTSAEELPPEPVAAVVEAYPPFNPLLWRGTSRRMA